MAEFVLFAAGSPGAPDEADGPIALATGFEIVLAGTYWVTHVEWFAPTNTPSGVEVAIWERVDDNTAGANLTGNLAWAGAITNGTRNRMALPVPIVVSTALYPNGLYVVLRTANRYTATAAYFNATGETNGPLRGWIKQLNKENGRFNVTGPPVDAVYPNDDFNGGGYWITPVVTDEDPGEADVNVTDLPGAGAAGGSPDATQAEALVTDTPGPSVAGGSAAVATVGVSVADRAGPAGTGGSTELIETGEPVFVTDQSGSASAGGSAAALEIEEAAPDVAVWPIVQQALTCLQTQMAAVQSPPKYVQIRPGVSFSAGLSGIEDECCEGSAWVRVVSIVPSDSFPSQAVTSPCHVNMLAVELEFGALRCRPVSSDIDPRNVVTGTQWADMTRLILGDAAALRRTACCLAALVGQSVIGQWSPQAVEANCAGGTMTMTVQASACDLVC